MVKNDKSQGDISGLDLRSQLLRTAAVNVLNALGEAVDLVVLDNHWFESPTEQAGQFVARYLRNFARRGEADFKEVVVQPRNPREGERIGANEHSGTRLIFRTDKNGDEGIVNVRGGLSRDPVRADYRDTSYASLQGRGHSERTIWHLSKPTFCDLRLLVKDPPADIRSTFKSEPGLSLSLQELTLVDQRGVNKIFNQQSGLLIDSHHPRFHEVQGKLMSNVYLIVRNLESRG